MVSKSKSLNSTLTLYSYKGVNDLRRFRSTAVKSARFNEAVSGAESRPQSSFYINGRYPVIVVAE